MGDDEKVILLALELKNDRFKPYCKVVVRLSNG